MVKLLLFCLLVVFCWPLALLALVLYPLMWVLLLPFRIVGLVVRGCLRWWGQSCLCRCGCCDRYRVLFTLTPGLLAFVGAVFALVG